MHRFYDLTKTEEAVMDIFWELDEPATFKEIMDLINLKLDKEWKKQTVGTYLAKFQESGLIMANKRSMRAYLYTPACTKEEYKQMCVKRLIEEDFHNSIGEFVAAFTGGKKLSSRDAEELKKFL
ncbi:BlaI/MecI/CopY family transcriptional regulator [Lacrimispora sp.]|uniref:BlaI/MecI/CopY family transcriptional regulator n=1 Tax=Lacrimispora sp. TaxID=2719234 RepID=UPI003460E330